MKTAIVGYGFVGKAVKRLFPEAVVYDPYQPEFSGTKDKVGECSAVFICVPTPMSEDGSCDTSAVEESVAWLNAPLIIIRSTIPPGTTDRLQSGYKGEIVFQPEYVGETVAHPLLDERQTPFIVLGGRPAGIRAAIRLYQDVYNASVRIHSMRAVEAEVVKYMENCSIGATVTLCNEFYNLCRAFGADYNVVREGYLADPRMSRYFTFVYPEKRGFEGKCLPKDLNAIVKAGEKAGYLPEFIRDILKNNQRIRKNDARGDR
jgi:UDPglucose 6-dehydrogenase